MIKITANEKNLVLKEGTEITVKERNPLFESDISGTAYPFSLPGGDNLIALGMAHRPGKQLQKIDIGIEYGGYYRKMLGIITKASPSGYEMSAKIDDSIFLIQNGDRDIRDAFPIYNITLQNLIDNYSQYRIIGPDFCLPELPNPNFMGDNWYVGLYSKIQNDFNTTKPVKAYTPFFFVERIIRRIAENGGYTVTTNFDDIIRRCFIYNNTSVHYYTPWPHFDQNINAYHHLPKMSVRDFITEFCLFFNLKMYPNHSQKTIQFVSIDDVVSRPAVIDWSEYLVSEIVLAEEEKYEEIVLCYQVDQSDPASPWNANQEYDMAATSAFPTGVNEGTRVLIEYHNLIYVYGRDDEDQMVWKPYSIIYPEIRLGKGRPIKEIFPKFSALAGKVLDNPLSVDPTLAHCAYVGNWRDNSQYTEVPMRLGLLDQDGAAKNTISSGSIVSGPATNSINNKRYAKTLNWNLQGRRLAEATFRIPNHLLFNLDLTQKIYANGVTFFIEELNYRLTNNGIVYLPAKIRIF